MAQSFTKISPVIQNNNMLTVLLKPETKIPFRHVYEGKSGSIIELKNSEVVRTYIPTLVFANPGSVLKMVQAYMSKETDDAYVVRKVEPVAAGGDRVYVKAVYDCLVQHTL